MRGGDLMFPWEEVENVAPHRKFVMPLLPKPHYKALQTLMKTLNATDWEVICSLVQLATEDWYKGLKFRLYEELKAFRATAPSEAEIPLIDDSL